MRETKDFYTIRINLDEEICRRYDDIKMLSAFLERLGENSTKPMLKDTKSIDTQLFTLKLRDCCTVESNYDETRLLCEDLKSCGQPKPND